MAKTSTARDLPVQVKAAPPSAARKNAKPSGVAVKKTAAKKPAGAAAKKSQAKTAPPKRASAARRTATAKTPSPNKTSAAKNKAPAAKNKMTTANRMAAASRPATAKGKRPALNKARARKAAPPAKAPPTKAPSVKAPPVKAPTVKAGAAKKAAIRRPVVRPAAPAPAARRIRSLAAPRQATKARPAAKTGTSTPQVFTVSHLNHDDFKADGLRTYARYRDLGIAAASGGRCQAHVIRFTPPCTDEVRKPHLHQLELQLVYVLQGWMKNEFEGHGEQMMSAGSCWLQPSGIRHTVLDYSPDCEVLEIIVPADFKTEELKHDHAERNAQSQSSRDQPA